MWVSVFETRVQTRSSKGAFSGLMYCPVLTSDSSCLQLKRVYLPALSKNRTTKTIRSHQSITGRLSLMLLATKYKTSADFPIHNVAKRSQWTNIPKTKSLLKRILFRWYLSRPLKSKREVNMVNPKPKRFGGH